MKLYSDVTRLLHRHITDLSHTGIDRVNLEYARWAMGRGGSFCAKRNKELKHLPAHQWALSLLGEVQPGHRQNTKARRARTLVNWLSVGKPITPGSTVVVSTHSWLANAATWRWAKSRGLRIVVFIHDLIPIEFPEYQRPAEKMFHVNRIRLTLQNAAGLIVNSRCTESAVIRFARSEGLSVPPTLVAPLGHNFPTESDAPLPEGIRHPFFVALGTIEPRKNHLLLLALWRHLARTMGEKTPQLVIVGRRGWECEQVVDMLERCESIHPYMLEVNNASDDQVISLLKGARALLMPSFAEGFGMPVQEALALGTPVISSPLPAINEFAGDIPDYAEPHDGMRWEELIKAYATDTSQPRQAQLQRMTSFKDTSWEEHFALVENFLEEHLPRQVG